MTAADHTRSLGPLAAAVVLVAALLATTTGVGANGVEPASDAPDESRFTPADVFDDVPYPFPFYDEIYWAHGEQIVAGYADGLFHPSAAVTRQALAAMLRRYAFGPGAPPPCTSAPFTDVPVHHAFCADIAWLADEGIAEGYADGTFRPTAPVSRQAAAVMLLQMTPRVLAPRDAVACTEPLFTDVPVDHRFCDRIAWMVQEGITDGFADGTFRPTAPVSRQAAAAFVYRYDFGQNDTPVPSAGCATTTQEPVTSEERTLDVDGTERMYLLTVPEAHDEGEPLPLVLDFHGLGEGAVIHTQMSELNPVAAAEEFIAVFPQGTGSPVRWNTSVNTAANPDLRYISQLIETLKTALCIDVSRVYAMGLSNGAFMASVVGCTMADRIAAIAPVAGVIRPTECSPVRPLPVVAFHGTADPILLFNGGFGGIGGTTTTTVVPPDLNGPGYPANVAAWAAANGCEPTPTDTPVTDEVLHRAYNCEARTDVEFFIIIDGGHAWPGSAFSQSIASVVGYTTMDIHASEEAWWFLEQFHLPHIYIS
jgi:polyhydroxybutyrate depolymerase